MNHEHDNSGQADGRELLAAKRMLAIKKAREDILDFAKIKMPHPDDPDNPDMSLYRPARHHQVLAAALEQVAKGTMPRLIVTMPPRHGKTELVTKTLIPWTMGNDPYKSIIFATYNEDFAHDHGADIRTLVEEPVFAQTFPEFSLRKGGASRERIQSSRGGLAVFVGRGGSLTGRGADLLVIDDILKDAEEAESPTMREKCWEWFTKVAMTRLMTVGASVVIVMTRWHEDDLVGRLTDPSNACYNEEEAKKWKVIDLPALARGNDPLSRQPGEALWPERFPVEFLEAQKRLNPLGFSALYQQQPTPEDGDYFKRDWIKYYDPRQIDFSDLKIFAASDHAVGTSNKKNDRTVLLIAGVDRNQDIYLLDCYIGRDPTDKIVERMVDLMGQWKPIFWWAEHGHISLSIGPFLQKRMQERGVYCAVDEVRKMENKEQKAQSIRARMAMKKVYFPKAKFWTTEGIDELLKFPRGQHDDFVDALAYLGLKLTVQFGPSIHREPEDSTPKIGTLAWIKMDSAYRDRRRKADEARGGF